MHLVYKPLFGGSIEETLLQCISLSAACAGLLNFRLDSNINVRRKTAFLLNTLLVPVNVPSHQSSPSSSGSTSSRAHAEASTSATLHAPETQNAPVHANSHASMLSNPMSVATAPATLRALREHNILSVLIRELTSPTPYGADGEREGDIDFEEKVVR